MVQSNVLNSAAHESVAAGGSTNDMGAPEWSNWQLAALESVAGGGSTNQMAAPEWSNQTYLTL